MSKLMMWVFHFHSVYNSMRKVVLRFQMRANMRAFYGLVCTYFLKGIKKVMNSLQISVDHDKNSKCKCASPTDDIHHKVFNSY